MTASQAPREGPRRGQPGRPPGGLNLAESVNQVARNLPPESPQTEFTREDASSLRELERQQTRRTFLTVGGAAAATATGLTAIALMTRGCRKEPDETPKREAEEAGAPKVKVEVVKPTTPTKETRKEEPKPPKEEAPGDRITIGANTTVVIHNIKPSGTTIIWGLDAGDRITTDPTVSEREPIILPNGTGIEIAGAVVVPELGGKYTLTPGQAAILPKTERFPLPHGYAVTVKTGSKPREIRANMKEVGYTEVKPAKPAEKPRDDVVNAKLEAFDTGFRKMIGQHEDWGSYVEIVFSGNPSDPDYGAVYVNLTDKAKAEAGGKPENKVRIGPARSLRIEVNRGGHWVQIPPGTTAADARLGVELARALKQYSMVTSASEYRPGDVSPYDPRDLPPPRKGPVVDHYYEHRPKPKSTIEAERKLKERREEEERKRREEEKKVKPEPEDKRYI